MAKYIMLLKQSGEGCDYTIGCGMLWEVVETENIQEKIRETLEDFGADGTGDVLFTRMVFVPFDAATVVDVDLDKIYRQIRDDKDQQASKDNEEKERAEYERLKLKSGGQND
jgi:hypothetical protein